jgi:myo-inositol 2-dehydrogenase/D-chiro-inositol 1-dehydrogenase
MGSPKQVVRVGMIGAGEIARNHTANLRTIQDVHVVGAYDVSLEACAKFARDTTAKVFESQEELLDAVDAVYICTPPQYHRASAIAAAQAGVHVFCEKPLASGIEDALAIEAAVSKAPITFMVGFNFRFTGKFISLKELYARGALGAAHSFYCVRVLWLPHLAPNWRTDPRFIVGMTVESLSHDFDFMRWILGDAQSVCGAAVATSRPDLVGYDNIMSAAMLLECGAQASFHSSWASHVRMDAHGIVGTEGSCVVGMGQVRWRKQGDSEDRVVVDTSPDRAKSPHLREDEHFIQCLRTGQAPSAGVRDGVATVRISHAVLEAARRKCAVTI